MEPIFVIDRETGKIEEEQVYGAGLLKFFYSNPVGKPFSHFLSRLPFISSFFGWWQKLPFTKKNINPFIKKYHIDSTEFLTHNFNSFNDFFIRKLKARPLKGEAIIPTDGRFRFFQNISESEGFLIKGEKFSLITLLQDMSLADKYNHGSMILARLCPTDYHRFHFPVDCIPSESHLINGWLYSVNPVALKQDIHIFTKNKRMITTLRTEKYGDILFIEVGATNVGSIIQTYTPHQPTPKGSEKGYFQFGASALIILFEPGKITFAPDLLKQSDLEIKCKMGQNLT